MKIAESVNNRSFKKGGVWRVFLYENLGVYQKSLVLVKSIYGLLQQIKTADLNLKDQLKRAATSIPLNIAEGNGRATEKDKTRFLIQARGSVFEVGSALDILLTIEAIDKESFTGIKDRLIEISKMLSGLINRMRD